MKFFDRETKSALEAKEDAQRIAFAPVVFQAARILRDNGMLRTVEAAGDAGATEDEVAAKVNVSRYGVRVLLEAGLGIGLLIVQDGRYKLTKTSFFLLNDTLTRVNMDFIHDVCYQGLFSLDASLTTGKPEGLKVFGEWPTITKDCRACRHKCRKAGSASTIIIRIRLSTRHCPLCLKTNPHDCSTSEVTPGAGHSNA
ncbi:MAG: hypothetical protein HC859_05100 [Bacteroidia bacterium]|nr:hypothetical protein [Bacteroidia bacterium]